MGGGLLRPWPLWDNISQLHDNYNGDDYVFIPSDRLVEKGVKGKSFSKPYKWHFDIQERGYFTSAVGAPLVVDNLYGFLG